VADAGKKWEGVHTSKIALHGCDKILSNGHAFYALKLICSCLNTKSKKIANNI
jgi:hypothetical protein